MPHQAKRDLVVHVTLDDAFDGIIRLLGDALRFGTGLQALTLVAEPDGGAAATLVLAVPARIDAGQMVTRLARHPVVRAVEADGEAGAGLPPLVAAAVA